MSQTRKWKVAVEFETTPETDNPALGIKARAWTRERVESLFAHMLDELDRRHGTENARAVKIEAES